jgi:SAM-dependent methyltransferase
MSRRAITLLLVLCGLAVVQCWGQDTFQEEADRLATLLQWHFGSVVAEIGAGKGNLTLAASQRVGPSGNVYSTEIDEKALSYLEELAVKNKNITVIKGAEADTKLPPECCDSIFMRLVYHHLTSPNEIDASLFRSLKPGGRLAVIDENPREGTQVPEGVPKNRGGHGVPQNILIHELVAAGFKVEAISDDWPDHDTPHEIYCVTFSKPKSPRDSRPSLSGF